jgi:hypothetical protein
VTTRYSTYFVVTRTFITVLLRETDEMRIRAPTQAAADHRMDAPRLPEI